MRGWERFETKAGLGLGWRTRAGSHTDRASLLVDVLWGHRISGVPAGLIPIQ